MGMFSQTEIILMIGVVSTLLVIITILTILDIKDYVKNKNNEDVEEYQFGEKIEESTEEISQEKLAPVEVLEVNNQEEILISDVVDEKVVPYQENDNVEPLIEEFEEVDVQRDDHHAIVEPLIIEEPKIVEVEEEPVKVSVQEELHKVLDTLPEENKVITSFEEEQERTAIISLDELMSKSEELYNSNEIIQYDDGNEPISIDEAISMYNQDENTSPIAIQNDVEESKELYTHKETTPFISSVYGIETGNNSLEFENTATYEKLSRVKKNEFLSQLREKYENK